MTTELPLDPFERQALRDAELRDAIAAAALRIPISRSLKCKGEATPYGRQLHTGMPDGCRNSGVGCLCACHDGPVKP